MPGAKTHTSFTKRGIACSRLRDIGFAEKRKREHEKLERGGRVPFTFASCPLSESVEKGLTWKAVEVVSGEGEWSGDPRVT